MFFLTKAFNFSGFFWRFRPRSAAGGLKSAEILYAPDTAIVKRFPRIITRTYIYYNIVLEFLQVYKVMYNKVLSVL